MVASTPREVIDVMLGKCPSYGNGDTCSPWHSLSFHPSGRFSGEFLGVRVLLADNGDINDW
jgi:hypothetical protein